MGVQVETKGVQQQVAALVGAGGDKDGHGCLKSAGYEWCAAMGKCIRRWEHGLRTSKDVAAVCNVLPLAPGPVVISAHKKGGDRDTHGCVKSAGYEWCASMNKCIRRWEHNLHSDGAVKALCDTRGVHPIVSGGTTVM